MNEDAFHHLHGTRREPGTVFRPEALLTSGTAWFGFGTMLMAELFLACIHGGMSPRDEAARSRLLGGE